MQQFCSNGRSVLGYHRTSCGITTPRREGKGPGRAGGKGEGSGGGGACVGGRRGSRHLTVDAALLLRGQRTAAQGEEGARGQRTCSTTCTDSGPRGINCVATGGEPAADPRRARRPRAGARAGVLGSSG